MAKIVFESQQKGDSLKLKDATNGLYIACEGNSSDHLMGGVVVVVLGGNVGYVSPVGALVMYDEKRNCSPNFLVRPMRPGEKLVCVE